MNRILKSTIYVFFTLGLSACVIDDAEQFELRELGAPESEYVVSPSAGQVKIDFFANVPGTIAFQNDVNWAAMSTGSFTGDGTCLVTYGRNDSFPRKAIVEFQTLGGERRDTVIIYQEGLCKPVLEFPKKSVIVYNGRGATVAALRSNVDFEQVEINVSYSSSSKEWIRGIKYENESLVIDTEDNTDPKELRSATVNLLFTDGWGKEMRSSLVLTQANAQNILGSEVSFADLRGMVSGDESVVIDDYLYIEGYIVSRKASGNCGENEMPTASSVDYSSSEKTSYIESVDASYGFRIVAATEADNTLDRYSRVRILLKDRKVTHLTQPDRFEISGIESSDVVSSETVSSASIPVKDKYISELTDEDIYTYVTLKDCELPIRKGSLTPVNEKFTNANNNGFMSKWPTLVRDIKGSSLYMYTNTTCPYRRDGSMLPNGSGDISGIIVHEKYRPFVDNDAADEDECGNIGRYQIRHMSWEEIDLATDFKSGFSELLTEVRFMVGDGRYLKTTYGVNGRLQHTCTASEYTYSTLGTSVKTIESYCYLGPVGPRADGFFGKNVGSQNGWGVILEDGTNKGVNDSKTNTDGQGRTTGGAFASWTSDYWWNYTTDTPYAWELEFSTTGISTDMLSLQVTQVNTSEYAGPRYWKVIWTSDDEDMNGIWEQVATYVVPDLLNGGSAKYCDLNGFKPMNFTLPLKMLGRNKVTIRLTPERNAAKNVAEGEYDTGEIAAKSRNGAPSNNLNGVSSMDYIAVRYNK